MQDWLAQQAITHPNRLALKCSSKSWTFSELDAWVGRIAAKLEKEGVEAGARVGVQLPNSPLYVGLILALVRLKAVQVPQNIRLQDHELLWQVNESECEKLISDRKIEGLEDMPVLKGDDFSDLPKDRIAGKEFDPDMVQAIFFTSGTTGQPKGAMITLGNLASSAEASRERLGAEADDRWLVSLPLYHIGGQSIIFRSALYGTAVVLVDSFDAEKIYSTICKEEITTVSLVPTLLGRMMPLFEDKGVPKDLRSILLGGAAASKDLVERGLKIGLPICLTYGLTEATSQVATSTTEGTRVKPGSVGKPLNHMRIEIIGPEGEVLPIDEVGEIAVRGAGVFAGYLGQAPSNGVLHTGDLGWLDKEGDLWIATRRTDLIVSGGENVYPQEVENVLREHPAVEEACVVGIPDEEWGERVTALLIMSEETEAEKIDRYVRERLAGYKAPKTYHFVEALPMTASGKIRRKEAKDSLFESLKTIPL